MAVNKSQGPAGASGRRLKARLAQEGRKLSLLGEDDETVDREYIKLFGLNHYRELGQKYGLEYAESFYYLNPGPSFIGTVDQGQVHAYIDEHAEPI